MAYSSVPNRCAVRNKRAGGKIVSKSINVQTKIRPCRGEFFLKINKRACTSIGYTRVDTFLIQTFLRSLGLLKGQIFGIGV